MRVSRLSKLVAMPSYLDESRSCSGMGPCGRFMRDDASVVFHLMAIGVACGSWVETLCVRIFR